jgi:hypothetical protein
MSSAATPVKNIPGIAKAIPGSDENHSSSRRNHCSPSARNPVRLHPGIVFAITPESLFALPRNPQLATASRDPGQFMDAMEVAYAFFSWTSRRRLSGAYNGPEMVWQEAWAKIGEQTRSALALPQSVSEIIPSEAIFNASTYWREWFDFDSD